MNLAVKQKIHSRSKKDTHWIVPFFNYSEMESEKIRQSLIDKFNEKNSRGSSFLSLSCEDFAKTC